MAVSNRTNGARLQGDMVRYVSLWATSYVVCMYEYVCTYESMYVYIYIYIYHV